MPLQKKSSANSPLFLGFLTAPILAAWFFFGPNILYPPIHPDQTEILSTELENLGLNDVVSRWSFRRLANYQFKSGKSLSEILNEPQWQQEMGLTAQVFKATYYIANPFEFLPIGLQKAIREMPKPFRTEREVWAWARENKIPSDWKKALRWALVESAPENLWRAAHGRRPYVRSGHYLEPIAVYRGPGDIEFQDGDIAIDPSILPFDDNVLVVVSHPKETKVLRASSRDTGSRIRGKHIDLPIYIDMKNHPHDVRQKAMRKIRNTSQTVDILRPL